MKAHVIVVAAGSGSRFGSTLPKQFCELMGRPVLMHTVERLRSALPGAAMTLVLSRQMEDYWCELCRRHSFDSPRIVHGGATRSESVRNAVGAISDAPEVVLVHDGARPLVDAACVHAVMEAMADCDIDGAIPVVAVSDSLRRIHTDGGASDAVDRTMFRAVQTPQAFRYDKLSMAYAADGALDFSDDASLMEYCGYGKIVLTDGSSSNIKITNPADLAVAGCILAMQMQ